ncbi:TatD family hydrolase [Candidatus Saccharibacteria bacterium]|nr:TatD family hydrolase [Candidatus Saccharibacteria bacterium]
MLIDTHCHIHDRETYDFVISHQHNPLKENYDPEKILKRAHENGIEKMITIGTSHKDSLAARAFAEAHPSVSWSYGIHPDEATSPGAGGALRGPAAPRAEGERGWMGDTTRPPLGTRKAEGLQDPPGKLAAIGEVGLDYHQGEGARAAQIKLLERMLELAIKNDLPLIFHVRDAFDDFWPIVDNAGIKRAVVHSFSDNEENLKRALDHDFYIGVNGLATFADLPTPPLERTLLETDAPFLAPVPVRGHVNEPAYIKNIAEFLVEKHGRTLEEIAEITTKNAEKLFKI